MSILHSTPDIDVGGIRGVDLGNQRKQQIPEVMTFVGYGACELLPVDADPMRIDDDRWVMAALLDTSPAK